MPDFIYVEIAAKLKRRMQNGEFPDGRLPSERELAAEFGVNRLTLRRALKDLREDGTVISLGQRGTFVSGTASIKGKIAIVISGINFQYMNNSYFNSICDALRRALQWNGFESEVHLVSNASELDSRLEPGSVRRCLDAFIMMGGNSLPILKRVATVNLPIVMIGRAGRRDDLEDRCDRIAEAPDCSAGEAVRILKAKGFSRIAYLGTQRGSQWTELSFSAYKEAIAESGLPSDESLSVFLESVDASAGMNLIASGFLERSGADALFVRNEIVARGILDGLMAKGIRVPLDLPVFVYGHEGDSVSHLGVPRFEIKPSLLADTAVRLLMRRLAMPSAPVLHEELKASLSMPVDIPAKV